MQNTGYAYFVESPRVIEDLMTPHPVERERRYEIAKTVRLAKIDYENFIRDMIADRQFILFKTYKLILFYVTNSRVFVGQFRLIDYLNQLVHSCDQKSARAACRVYLMVVFDTSPICVTSPETA